MSSHQDWEEIAAGHALGALEPDDEQRFEAHLRTCAQCRQVLADTEAVMADLAFAAEPSTPSPELKSRLLAAIHDESAGPSMAAVSSPDRLELRRRRKPRGPLDVFVEHWVPFAAAASVILLAVIAAGVWTINGTKTAPSPRLVALQSTTGPSTAATVMVLGQDAYVIPTNLPENNRANSQYVLWSKPVHGDVRAIGGFDVEDGHAIVSVGDIGPLASVTGFAVSAEPGRTLPTKPTQVVAAGQADWPTSSAFRNFD